MTAIEIECVWLGATRYYLIGSKTADTHLYCCLLINVWWKLSKRLRRYIQHNVEREFERDDEARKSRNEHLPLGMDCDREAWEQVRALWRDKDKNPANKDAINDTLKDISPRLPDEMSVSGHCPKCGGTLRPGKALVNGWSGCDDMGEICTVSLDPRISKMIDCMKCEKCGWSVSAGENQEVLPT